MNAKIEQLSPKDLSSADLEPRGDSHRSPETWRVQIVCSLLLDRFSDDKEETDQRTLFDRKKAKRMRIKRRCGVDASRKNLLKTIPRCRMYTQAGEIINEVQVILPPAGIAI